MNLTKDTYEYLLNFADDRDIINMLSVNKKFHDEEFFERIMKRKYPDLIQYREENESWKSLFVKMVYYISRFKEEYKIPYFPGLNILELFSNKDANPLFLIVRNAAKVGNLEIIKLLNLAPKSIMFSEALLTAAENGHLNIIEYLLSQQPLHITGVAVRAIYNGHLNVIRYLIDNKYAKKLNLYLDVAAEYNQKEILDYLISQGADGFESAIYHARLAGLKDMTNYLQTFL